jgi:uncharacterized membrane protein
MRNKRELLFLIISFVGVLLSLYAIPLHYADTSSLCDINDVLSCTNVNQSPWSTFVGIPVAILGLIAYIAVFFAMLFRKRIQRTLSFTSRDFSQYLLLVTGIMFGFQLYLTYTEAFLIGAYCVVCLLSQVCVFLLATISLVDYFRSDA